jgi:hypothetical protein
MIPLHRLILTLSLLATAKLAATTARPNPPGGDPPEDNKCKSGSSSSSPPSNRSLDWSISVGLVRYAKPATLTTLGQAVSEKNGNLLDFDQLFSRYFSDSPLQQKQISLELS